MEKKRDKYLLETYKIVLSLVIIGIIGTYIESRLSAAAESREKELLKYELALRSFQSVSSTVAKLRATAHRLASNEAGLENESLLQTYNGAYLEFVEAKVGFIHAMSRIGIGSDSDTQTFRDLNVASVELDQCIFDSVNRADSCELTQVYSGFVKKSADFEEKLLSLFESNKNS